MKGFDEYASEYDAALDLGLSVSGENKQYFASGRIDWLRRCLKKLGERPASIFDFGCGVGTSIPYLLELPGAKSVLGLDESVKSLDAGRKQLDSGRVRMLPLVDHRAAAEFDLGFSNGVFHHIPVAERPAAMKRIMDTLRPGGLFALWENNPWNPGTRLVMKRIPFDRNAITLSAIGASRLARFAGFEIVRIDFLFIFPRAMRPLRALEPMLAKLPFGAQYQILCRKPREA